MVGIDDSIFYNPNKIVKHILDGKTFTRDNIYNVITNDKRIEIIKFCAKEKKTITQIKKHLGLSYNPTWKHIQQLVNKGLVEQEHGTDNKGAVVYIKTVNPGDYILHGKSIK